MKPMRIGLSIELMHINTTPIPFTKPANRPKASTNNTLESEMQSVDLRLMIGAKKKRSYGTYVITAKNQNFSFFKETNPTNFSGYLSKLLQSFL